MCKLSVKLAKERTVFAKVWHGGDGYGKPLTILWGYPGCPGCEARYEDLDTVDQQTDLEIAAWVCPCGEYVWLVKLAEKPDDSV